MAYAVPLIASVFLTLVTPVTTRVADVSWWHTEGGSVVEHRFAPPDLHSNCLLTFKEKDTTIQFNWEPEAPSHVVAQTTSWRRPEQTFVRAAIQVGDTWLGSGSEHSLDREAIADNDKIVFMTKQPVDALLQNADSIRVRVSDGEQVKVQLPPKDKLFNLVVAVQQCREAAHLSP